MHDDLYREGWNAFQERKDYDDSKSEDWKRGWHDASARNLKAGIKENSIIAMLMEFDDNYVHILDELSNLYTKYVRIKEKLCEDKVIFVTSNVNYVVVGQADSVQLFFIPFSREIPAHGFIARGLNPAWLSLYGTEPIKISKYEQTGIDTFANGHSAYVFSITTMPLLETK